MTTVYPTSQLKRSRRTKVEMVEFRGAIHRIVKTNRPCSVRQVYYLGAGDLWEKDAGNRTNYQRCDDLLGEMREAGILPWGWITDSTRFCRIADMHGSAEDAMTEWSSMYRRDLWASQPRHVEIWAESDSVAGIIDSVTRPLGVGLFSCRGQAGKTFVWESVQNWLRIGKPVTVGYCGDWDATGLAIPRSLLERFRRYSKGQIDIELVRLALTADDVRDGRLKNHYINKADKNYRRFKTECLTLDLDPEVAVEIEALPPQQLRDRIEARIYDLIDDSEAWNMTLAFEESEREIFARMVPHVRTEARRAQDEWSAAQ